MVFSCSGVGIVDWAGSTLSMDSGCFLSGCRIVVRSAVEETLPPTLSVLSVSRRVFRGRFMPKVMRHSPHAAACPAYTSGLCARPADHKQQCFPLQPACQHPFHLQHGDPPVSSSVPNDVSQFGSGIDSVSPASPAAGFGVRIRPGTLAVASSIQPTRCQSGI